MSEPVLSAPADRAIDLLIANEPAEALRWSLAILEREPASSLGLFATSRALARLGSTRAATDGLRATALRAAASGDVLLAIAALGDVQALGADGRPLADEIADAIRRTANEAPDASLRFALQAHLQPLAPVVGERALVARATQRIYESASFERGAAGPLDFFPSLSHEATRDLLLAFETAMVPANHPLVEEGETGDSACLLVRGGAEIRRRGGSPGEPHVLARLEAGAFFGELALLARVPSPSSVVTTRGSLLVLAWHDAIEAVGAKHPDVRFELGAHCKRQAAANLGTALSVLDAVPLQERAAFVDRMDFRTFERGDRLAKLGEEPDGLHVVVSGGVLLVARDGAERVVLQTLVPGDTVGETELVFCRPATTEAIAVSHTATLFLPRSEFAALARDYPAILHGVYGAASRRNAETSGALDARAANVEDDVVLDEEPAESERTGPHVRALAAQPPPPPDPQVEATVAEEAAAPPEAAPPPRAVPVSVPPPITAPSPVQPPAVISARSAVSVPAPRSSLSSVAPATVSQKPPATPRARGPLAQRYVRATVIVACAAGVCALLAPRGDRSFANVPPSAGGEGPPSPVSELSAGGAPSPAMASVPPSPSPAAPPPSASSPAHAPPAPAAPSTKRASPPVPSTTAPHPAASSPPSPSARSTAHAPPAPAASTATTAHAVDDFGGRE